MTCKQVITMLLFMRLVCPRDSVQNNAPRAAGCSSLALHLCAWRWQVTHRLLSIIVPLQILACSLVLAFTIIGSVSAGSLLVHFLFLSFFFLVMDFYSPFQKTKQIVCLTSTGVSGPGVAWEGKRTDYSCGQTSLGVSTQILD